MNKLFGHLLLLAMFAVSFSSCKISSPVFKTVDNIHFEHINTGGLKLAADAKFNNPNSIKCRITDVDINVVLDDKLIGFLGEKSDVIVQKKSDFAIPLGILIKPDGTVLEDLKAFYKILANKPSELYLVGTVQVKAMGIKVNIPIKYRQVLKRSDFKT